MLKLFRLEAADSAGRVVQSVCYRYGQREPHLAANVRRLLSSIDRAKFADMRARGLRVRASREPL